MAASRAAEHRRAPRKSADDRRGMAFCRGRWRAAGGPKRAGAFTHNCMLPDRARGANRKHAGSESRAWLLTGAAGGAVPVRACWRCVGGRARACAQAAGRVSGRPAAGRWQ